MKKYIYSLHDDCIMTTEQQKEIVEWVKINYTYFKSSGYNRYMQLLNYFDDVPKCIWEIKNRIVDKELLHEFQEEPIFKDSIGYMMDGGQLHNHVDPNPINEELYHTRFNVYVQIPNKGGMPIYNNNLYQLKEMTYICCRSGIDYHSCEKVEGERERIVLSFGFLLPFERIKNITYNYSSSTEIIGHAIVK